MRVGDLPVVFLSYDEPWADAFFADLQAKHPAALRVHGVEGLDACHKAAARAAGTRWFVTVDADTLVEPAFFDAEIPSDYLTDAARIEWASRNAVNGLSYGNGSLKVWPAAMVRRLRTHEAAPEGTPSVDHGINASGGDLFGLHMPNVLSTTHPAGTPYHAFRCGYREGARLSTMGTDRRGRGFEAQLSPWHRRRLHVWLSIGAHARNGAWMIHGARMGLLAAQGGGWDLRLLNDFAWFQALWRDAVLPRVAGSAARCDVSGAEWDPALLDEESAGLGRRLAAELGIETAEVTAETSAFIAARISESRSPAVVEILGNAYLRGRAVAPDPVRARRYFEIGRALNLAAAHNSAARMDEAAGDLDAAQAGYEVAVALEDRFAPWHLARLIERRGAPSVARDARVAALVALAGSRGFAP